MEEQFIELLNLTGRRGMDRVIDYLSKSDFFIAPASARRHLSHPGGLAEHSMNVLKMAMKIREKVIEVKPEAESLLKEDSIVIAALLHDICKSNIYKKVLKWRKDESDKWEQYDTYETDYSRFPVGHGEKSVIMLLHLGLEMTNDEMIAIRWHMGAWNLAQTYEETSNISEANNHPLTVVLQSADLLASHILESDN